MADSAGLQARRVMSPFWLAAWSVALSLGWLLPNHYLPWSAFHFDFWIACVISLAGAALLLRSAASFRWYRTALLVGSLVFLPWLQEATGMIDFIGTTWVTSAYLLGLLLALLFAAQWESITPGQLGDGLFLAIGLASLVSVGLQLQQWLGLGGLDDMQAWIMIDNSGRPFANFGQPNQLATFLVWSLLAVAWAWVRKRVSAPIAILAALYLLFGLAMTHSRTGWIAMALLVVSTWYWRRQWPSARVPWVVTGLGICFFLYVVSLNELREVLLLSEPSDLIDPLRLSGEPRPTIWALFVDGAVQRPWSGYGWNQTFLAQLQVAADHPGLGSTFSSAHNLFLDLIVWAGIPIGLAITVCLVMWMWRNVRSVRKAEDVLLVLFLLVVANHAMLELPLYYAYILLPTGLVAGMLDVRLTSPIARTSRAVPLCLLLMGVTMLVLFVSDYAQIEPAILQQRFEQANIKTPPRQTLDVRLLTQLQARVRMSDFEPGEHISDADLDWMRKAVTLNHAPATFQKLAAALAWRGHPEEAALWLRRSCKVAPEVQCALLMQSWDRMTRTDPRIAAVSWPD